MADAPAAPFDIPCDLLQKGWQIHAIEVEDARKEPAPRSGSASSDFRCRVTAIIFGALTIVSGGRALFGGPDMGAVVSLVLRFNFVA